MLDRDGDGKIDRTDLEHVCAKLGLGSIFSSFNLDSSVDFGQFMTRLLSSNIDDIDNKEKAHKVSYKLFDRANKGSIGPEDINRVLSELDDPIPNDETREMTGHMDVEGNKQIGYEEYVKGVNVQINRR